MLPARVTQMLTPAVVKHLPDSFHGISTIDQAKLWLHQISNESRLCLVRETNTASIIGLLFIHEENGKAAHIGYFLDQPVWGKGLAHEMLNGLIEFAAPGKQWSVLRAGVNRDNARSIQLLLKLGFTPVAEAGKTTDCFEFWFE